MKHFAVVGLIIAAYIAWQLTELVQVQKATVLYDACLDTIGRVSAAGPDLCAKDLRRQLP